MPISYSGTIKFRNLIDPAKRNYLLDTLASAWENQQAGLGEGSKRQQSGNFDRWRRFLDVCGIYDEFLDNFTIEQRIAILSAYAPSVRKMTLVNNTNDVWQDPPSKPPLHTYVRPFGRTYGVTRF